MRVVPAILLLFSVMITAAPADKTNVTGLWSTKEPGSREPQIYIRVYKQNGRIYGKIVRLLYVKNPPTAIVPINGGELKRPLLGTTILRDLIKAQDSWENGILLDPSSGSEYRCRVWRVGGHLKVRGYQFIFHKTLTWFPTTDTALLETDTRIARKGR